MNFVKKKEALEKCVKITHTTLFDQNKLSFQKLDVIMNLELALKKPKVLIIIVFIRFHFKVVVQGVLQKKLKFSSIELFWVLFGFACGNILHSTC